MDDMQNRFNGRSTLVFGACGLAISFFAMQSLILVPDVFAESLPAGTLVTTGPYPKGGDIHVVVVSDPGLRTIFFPDPPGHVDKLLSTVTTYVDEAVLYFESEGVTYSIDIAPNSNTMLKFAHPMEITNVQVTIQGRGFPDDAVHAEYFKPVEPLHDDVDEKESSSNPISHSESLIDDSLVSYEASDIKHVENDDISEGIVLALPPKDMRLKTSLTEELDLLSSLPSNSLDTVVGDSSVEEGNPNIARASMDLTELSLVLMIAIGLPLISQNLVTLEKRMKLICR